MSQSSQPNGVPSNEPLSQSSQPDGVPSNESLKPADSYESMQAIEKLEQFNQNITDSFGLFHSIGYGLLILSLFDVLALLIPPQFLNPLWEFQFFGQVVERIPVPLLGLILVFFGERRARGNWEFSCLHFLSWSTLWLGVLMFLFIPLSIVDTFRIDRQSQTQLSGQVDQQLAQLDTVKGQLDQVSSSTELETLLRSLGNQQPVPQIEDPAQLEELKENIQSSLDTSAAQAESQVQATISERRLTLLKNTVKWNIGALISSLLFFTIWRGTRWARQLYVRRY